MWGLCLFSLVSGVGEFSLLASLKIPVSNFPRCGVWGLQLTNKWIRSTIHVLIHQSNETLTSHPHRDIVEESCGIEALSNKKMAQGGGFDKYCVPTYQLCTPGENLWVLQSPSRHHMRGQRFSGQDQTLVGLGEQDKLINQFYRFK